MTDAEFLRNFKKHLGIFRKRISKKEVLKNLQRHRCPFELPGFDLKLHSRFLGLNRGKIVSFWEADAKYEKTAKHDFQYLILKMIEIVKATRWKDK